MFGLGTPELLIFAVIVLILFGKRIPETMRSIGQGLREFKRGAEGEDGDVLANIR